MTAPAAHPARRWAALAALGLLALGTLALGLADHLAERNPAAALRLFPNHPDALLRAATAAEAESPDAATQARAALRRQPLDGRGYRVLSAGAATPEEAFALLEVAVKRAPRDLPGRSRLVARALQRGEFAAAVDHLDRMLRVEPRVAERVFPVLAGLAVAPEARGALVERLAADPPWRSGWLAVVSRRAPDSAAVAPVFQQLLAMPGGLTDDEARGWLDRLVRDRQWGPAYLTWVATLPPARRESIGNVYDGGFEGEPSGIGFDWRIERVPGARVEFAPVRGAGGARALSVDFDHRRVPFQHVRQLLALPPGPYRLEGRARLESLRSGRGLVWTVRCAEGRKALADSDPFAGNRPAWTEFAMDFDVPEQGCGGQWLTLRLPSRVAAEQRIGGTAWFDDLKVRRRTTTVP